MRYIYVNKQVKIAVEELNPQGKKTILFIHGWPLSHKIFEYQTDVLASQDYRIVLMDLRGFGQSDTTVNGYSYVGLAKDLYKVIESLHVNTLTLVGFSMGGAIAIRYMSLFKGYKISKLVLLGAAAPSFTQHAGYPYGLTKEEVNALIGRTYRDRPQMVEDFGKKLFATNQSQSMRMWFRDIGWSASGIGTIQTAKSLRDEDLSEDLKYIKVPTGIFHGKKDEICPFIFAQLMNEGIKGSRLYPFEESGHALFIDEMEKFNETFLTFLEC